MIDFEDLRKSLEMQGINGALTTEFVELPQGLALRDIPLPEKENARRFIETGTFTGKTYQAGAWFALSAHTPDGSAENLRLNKVVVDPRSPSYDRLALLSNIILFMDELVECRENAPPCDDPGCPVLVTTYGGPDGEDAHQEVIWANPKILARKGFREARGPYIPKRLLAQLPLAGPLN